VPMIMCVRTVHSTTNESAINNYGFMYTYNKLSPWPCCYQSMY